MLRREWAASSRELTLSFVLTFGPSRCMLLSGGGDWSVGHLASDQDSSQGCGPPWLPLPSLPFWLACLLLPPPAFGQGRVCFSMARVAVFSEGADRGALSEGAGGDPASVPGEATCHFSLRLLSAQAPPNLPTRLGDKVLSPGSSPARCRVTTSPVSSELR